MFDASSFVHHPRTPVIPAQAGIHPADWLLRPRSRTSLSRLLQGLVAGMIPLLLTPVAPADTIDLRLNVFYTTPTNVQSGGTWELVAKSDTGSNFGIAGLRAYIKNIAVATPTIEAPRGTVNSSNPAGFQLFDFFHPASNPNPAYHELTIGQVPIDSPSTEQGAFYGVGTIPNGSPDFPGKPVGSNSIGPTFTTLTNTQDIPWGTGDSLGNAAWDIAARMTSGTFPAGVTPAFLSSNDGDVFITVGNSTTWGNEAQATGVNTSVRTNFALNADFNHNGVVDAADYVLWRKTKNTSVTTPGSGADGNGDGFINQLDYNLWRSRFGNPFGSGAGGDLSTGSVPEPMSGMLGAIGALLFVIGSRRQPSFPRTRRQPVIPAQAGIQMKTYIHSCARCELPAVNN
jgi:hypothetical protein